MVKEYMRSDYNDQFTYSFKSTGISAMDVLSILKEDRYLFIGTNKGGLFRSTNAGFDWRKFQAQLFIEFPKSKEILMTSCIWEQIMASTDL